MSRSRYTSLSGSHVEPDFEAVARNTSPELEPLDGFPTLRVFGPAKGRLLNLITCAGHFDPVRRTYDHRLVVSATLV